MRSIKIAGLCLVAVFALGAVVAASASAATAEPTFVQCVKAGKAAKGSEHKYTGSFKNKECTEAEAGGKYELATPAATPVKGKSKTTTITTKGVDGNAEVVVCKKDTITGEVAGGEIVGTFKFEKCEGNDSKTDKCGNVGSETIETQLNEYGDLPDAVPYYINSGLKEVGLEWYLQNLDFTCGTEKVELDGYLLGTAVNTSKGVTVTFNVAGGHQEDRTICGEEGGKAVCYGEQNNMFSLPGEWNTTESTVVGTEELGMKGVSIRES